MQKVSLLLVLLIAILGTTASAVEISTMNNIGGHMEYAGFTIVPAYDVSTPYHPNDPGPTQVFELIRPNYQSVTLGRLYTSCTCIQLETEKKSYSSGERVLITVRNVLPTKGQTYPFYLQLSSPIRAILRHDTYVISDRFAATETITQSYIASPITQQTTTHQVISPNCDNASTSIPTIGEYYLNDLDLSK